MHACMDIITYMHAASIYTKHIISGMINPNAIYYKFMQELNDLKREVPGLKGALTKQHTELQQVAEQIDELEAYKQMVKL